MKINGVELKDIDIFDADTAEAYENALDKLINSVEKFKGLSTSQVIRKQCALIFDMFNSVFGEGTDKLVFGGKTNLKVCMKAFEELVENINSQKNEVEKITSKYSSNRAQRRSKK